MMCISQSALRWGAGNLYLVAALLSIAQAFSWAPMVTAAGTAQRVEESKKVVSCERQAPADARGCSLTTLSIQRVLDLHNSARLHANASNMNAIQWSNALADDACRIAQSRNAIIKSSKYSHTITSTHGPPDPEALVRDWGRLGAYYTYTATCPAAGLGASYCGACHMHDTRACESFVQMVWAATTTVGCGVFFDAENNAGYFACSYDPPGLISGQPPFAWSDAPLGCPGSPRGGGESRRWWQYLLIAGGVLLVFFGGGAYLYADDSCCCFDDAKRDAGANRKTGAPHNFSRDRTGGASKIGPAPDDFRTAYTPMEDL